jgi:hypothetical protein
MRKQSEGHEGKRCRRALTWQREWEVSSKASTTHPRTLYTTERRASAGHVLEDERLAEQPSVPTLRETASSGFFCSEGRRLEPRTCPNRTLFLVVLTMPSPMPRSAHAV